VARLLADVLFVVMEHDGGSSTSHIVVTHTYLAQDYFSRIKHPIDLRTIERRVHAVGCGACPCCSLAHTCWFDGCVVGTSASKVCFNKVYDVRVLALHRQGKGSGYFKWREFDKVMSRLFANALE
jgi:hypothetical protein